MRKRIYIVCLLGFLLPGCFTGRLEFIDQQVRFAKKNTGLIREMAEYAIFFCHKNNIREFHTDMIADKTTRKKMSKLGWTVNVTYGASADGDSMVSFKNTSLNQGVQEFLYDFKTHPRNKGSEPTISKESASIQVSERIYYRKGPFPMM